MTVITYRRDVDGLRGVSVLGVILFHANPLWLGAGYLGVDVFFVISGFLITNIIATEIEEGTFNIGRFYERRIRRIFPALFAMLFVSMGAAYVLLLPQDLVSFAKSAIGVATFSSNLVFSGRLGYFDQDAHLEPLLHTWSLAVEEQFYVLFPLMMLGSMRWLPRRSSWIIGAIALISFAIAVGFAHKNQPFVFFNLVARAWELLSGALVAQWVRGPGGKRSYSMGQELAAMIGLTLVVGSFVFLDSTPSSRAINNIFPVVGASLLLACQPQTLAARLLSCRGVVWVGLISYSAYLWHQPLFAFARYFGIQDHWPVLICLMLASVLTGYVSFRFVEQPFRRKTAASRKVVFRIAFLSMLITVVVAGLAIHVRGFPERVPRGIEWRSLGEKLEVIGDVCKLKPLPEYPGVESCRFGRADAGKVLALYGDSHAQAISFELDRQLKDRGEAGVWIKATGCHVIPSIVENGDMGTYSLCQASFKELLRYIRSETAGVVVASRWTVRLYPIPGQIDALNFDNGEGGVEYLPYRVYSAVDVDGKADMGESAKRRALNSFLASMDGTGKPIVLIYPVPELGWDIAKVNFQARGMLDSLSTSRRLYLDRNAFVLNVFDQYTSHNLIKLPTVDLFCDAYRCFGQKNGIAYYYDDDHLSSAGAQMVVERALEAMP